MGTVPGGTSTFWGQVERAAKGRKFMAVDPTVPDGARVFLYTPAGLVEGVSGVLIRVEEKDRSLTESGDEEGPVGIALVAPWPDSLTYSTRFAVAVVAGPRPTWHKPETVEIFRLEGAPEESNVAAVVLAGPPDSSAVSPTVGRANVRSALDNSGNLRQSIGTFVGPEFLRNDPPPTTGAATSASTADRTQNTAQPSWFRATLGTVPTVTDGLCRIFHWD
jgi:hypothetical protein